AVDRRRVADPSPRSGRQIHRRHPGVKILATARLEEDDLARLAGRAEVDYVDWYTRRLSAEELAKRLADVEVLVTEIDRVDEALLARAPALQVVIDCRGNPVNVDLGAAARRGVLVVNTPGRNADSVAEVTVALVLLCAHRIAEAMRAVAAREWGRVQAGSLYRRLQGVE